MTLPAFAAEYAADWPFGGKQTGGRTPDRYIDPLRNNVLWLQ